MFGKNVGGADFELALDDFADSVESGTIGLINGSPKVVIGVLGALLGTLGAV